MKLGDLIKFKNCSAKSYITELKFPEKFVGLVIKYTPMDWSISRWYAEVLLSVPTEGGKVFRLLLTEEEVLNNFEVIL